MIVLIEFVGTLRNLIGIDRYQINLEKNTNISKLLTNLKGEFSEIKDLDELNILILVNGKEINILQGFETELKINDIVTLIPISHGG